MSEGSTSGVNWIRPYCKPSARLKASAVVVFPVPGTSSSSTWPRESTVIMIFSSTSSLPAMTFFTSFRIFSTLVFICFSPLTILYNSCRWKRRSCRWRW